MKNKYQNHNPNLNNRDNNLQIKIGGENRYLTRKNYNQENENLCINPTTIQMKPNNQNLNYSEQGRINQRGQSHGYNIISNEPFQNNTNVEKNSYTRVDNGIIKVCIAENGDPSQVKLTKEIEAKY